MDVADLEARLDCVARTWTPRQRLHVGNVAWAFARGDGSTVPDLTLTWGSPLRGFADIWLPEQPTGPATAALHLGEGMTTRQMADAVDEVRRAASGITLQVSLQQSALVDVLTGRGFRRTAGPWFAQLWGSLGDLRTHHPPAGCAIRAVRRDELAARVEVHRRCWAPTRIRRMLGLPVIGDEPGSSYAVEKHRAVTGTPVYREELDLVAEADDGTLAGYSLGWLDPRSGSVLFEPVGTVPAYAGRGLARALCAQTLRVARDLGATQAIVGPRGDDAYPVPRRLYEGLGMHEIGQVVSFTDR